MLWVKTFHVLAVMAWLAGLFYLPRIFVNYAQARDAGEPTARLVGMARRLFRFASILAVVASRFQGVELSFLLMPMLLSGVLFDVAFTLARRALAGERLTQPHRGHLYQVAHRTGVRAEAVTLVHWGFAVFGGLCCLIFIVAPSPAKPFVPFLTLLPQAAWLFYVTTRARTAGLARWG